MKISASFGCLYGDPDAVVLVHAIDEFQWEAMPEEDVDAAVAAARANYGDVTDIRTVWLDVPDASLSALFEVQEIATTIEGDPA